MALEHDSVQRRLLKPEAIYCYKDPKELRTGIDAYVDESHQIIEADILEHEAQWKTPNFLSNSELLDWVRVEGLDGPKRDSMRILFALPVSARPPTLSVPAGFMRGLEEYFAVPSELYRVLHRSLPITVQFESTETKSGARIHGLIMRNQSAWLMEYTLLHLYIPSRNASTSICFGLSGDEIHRMLAYLVSSRRSGVSHLLLPFLLLDESIEASSSFIDRRREAMQEDAKLDLFLVKQGSNTRKEDAIDMHRISRTLTACCTSIATLVCSAKAHRRFIRVLETLYEHAPQHSDDSDALVKAWLMPRVRARLKYLGDVTVAIEEEGEFLQTSIQSQVQTVHNLIAQADAGVQRNLSKLSTEMARITRRDSSDMRVIAGVTLLFLPATFTATLFSTSFFDFKPGSTGPHVMSRWFWLYWVVAVFLTLVVLASWLYTTHRENTKFHNMLLLEPGDGEDGIAGSTTKKDEVVVNARFDYTPADTRVLNEHLEKMGKTNGISANTINNAPVTLNKGFKKREPPRFSGMGGGY
ncbi:hypothetical protein P154DRAFT_621477 [Amniculicola lignicola CBS 123094]|uniref:Cora-domain-containing protein n=1 Tax=Amniculicola lignicola CBS 123094 TaxID=1392246 RepID=A0A6A5WCZ6_9PLEO|nr:hypothetical protein P154DRAFT_621477 [Amniculicola lignicola CBS 123094]